MVCKTSNSKLLMNTDKRLWGDLTAAFQYVKGAYKQEGERLFMRVDSDRIRGNSFQQSETALCLLYIRLFFPSLCKEGNLICGPGEEMTQSSPHCSVCRSCQVLLLFLVYFNFPDFPKSQRIQR